MYNHYYNFTFTNSFKSKIILPKNLNEIRKSIKKKFTLVGNLRSYGDSSIGRKSHISLKNFNKIIKIDKNKKYIEVEAGIYLLDLLKFCVKKGFTLACMPGCKYVTLGGMLANNVSGKLPQKNKIKHHVISLKLLNNQNKILECSNKKNKKLFDLTIGGKGLTGPILSAKLSLKKISSSEIYQKNIYFNSYKNFQLKLNENKKFEYVVVWLDFISNQFKGVLFFGKHLKGRGNLDFNFKDYKFPYYFIKFLRFFLKFKISTLLFNNLFQFKNKFFKEKKLDFNEFFFPQNKIKNWNYLFEINGFFQFMFYMKLKDTSIIVNKLKQELKKQKLFSNFAVLKFHRTNKVSLSLDFPINNNTDKIITLLNSFMDKNKLEVELSKDNVLRKINYKTLKNNPTLNLKNKKYFFRNYNSLFYDRLLRS